MQLDRQRSGKDSSKPKRKPFHIIVSSCKICNLPAAVRRDIEMMLATGWTQAAVLRHWNDMLEDEYGPNYLFGANMSVHSRKHVTVRETAIRQIIEQKAAQFGQDVEAVTGFLLTKEAVAEAIVASGLQNIAQGLTTVEPKELIAAVELLKDLETETQQIAVDELLRQFYAFQDAVKTIVPPEQWELVAAEFERNLRRTAPRAMATQVVSETQPALPPAPEQGAIEIELEDLPLADEELLDIVIEEGDIIDG